MLDPEPSAEGGGNPRVQGQEWGLLLGDKRLRWKTVSPATMFIADLVVSGSGKERPPPSRSQTWSCFGLRSPRLEGAQTEIPSPPLPTSVTLSRHPPCCVPPLVWEAGLTAAGDF